MSAPRVDTARVPLPTDSRKAWPPKRWQPALDQIAEASAWYSGDTDRLAALYGTQIANERVKFWSRQQQPKVRKRIHVPAAADIAMTAAGLLFGEPPELTIPEAHETKADTEAKAAEERLRDIVNQTGMPNVLLQGAELCSALGGVYLRPWWNLDVSDRPWLSVVHADHAIPEWSGPVLTAITFWRTLTVEKGTSVWRHLERHESGRIEHGLYVGDKDHLGDRVSLDRHEDTAGLAADENGIITLPTAIRGPAVRYVPNRLPNRRLRNLPGGQADIAGSEDLLDALDETMCADEATEILTDHGWVTYDQLSAGDTVLTLNHDSGMSEWQQVQEVCIYPAQARPMVSIENRSHSSLTTPNHRWPVERPHYRGGEYKKLSGHDREWALSAEFMWDDKVPIAAYCADVPAEPKYTDALVEVVGWFWTEGHIRKLRDGTPGRNVVITQSPTANPDLCERIRVALARLFGPAVDSFPRYGQRTTDGVPRWRERLNGHRQEFVLNADAGDIVQEHAPGRVPSHDFLQALTQAQLELFIEVSMLADNCGEHSLAQKSEPAAEAFQFACILAGHPTSVSHRDYRPRGVDYDMTVVRIRSQRHFWPRRAEPTTVTYDGHVWCPRTPNQTWLARRNGTVYFTGNTSWIRDIRVGQSRIIVPKEFLERRGRGSGAAFDLEQEVFSPLEIDPSTMSDGKAITPVNFTIRMEEHAGTFRDLFRQIVSSAGYSPQTFGLDPGGQGQVTATEIRARQQATGTTNEVKQRWWKPAVEDVAEMMLIIDRETLGNSRTVVMRPRLEFADTLVEDPRTTAETIELLNRAQAISIETRVRMAQPQLEGAELQAEVDRIRAEQGLNVADPTGGAPAP